MSQQNDLRESLVQRVRQLPIDSLQHLDSLIRRLEREDSSSLTPAATSLPIEAKDWPHAPLHRVCENGTYLVTAGTLNKEHFFNTADRLDVVERELLRLAKHYDWQLEAWAVFSNHYHFVGHFGASSGDLKTFQSHLHTVTATHVNRIDSLSSRRVWYNYWETQLTYQKSYFARLNYVHQNAVKHGLVRVANQYAWCSAAWFERTATPAQVKTIYRFKMDKVRVLDDFDVLQIR